jgi:hypothetical protein
MVDAPLVAMVCRGVFPDEYDIGGSRCYLSEDLLQRIAAILQTTINQEQIDALVQAFRQSILYNQEFSIAY